MRNRLLFLGLLLGAVVLVFEYINEEPPQSLSEIDKSVSFAEKRAPATSSSQQQPSNKARAGSGPSYPSEESPEAVKKFKSWFETVSADIEASGSSNFFGLDEIKQRASQLTLDQQEWLVQLAVDTQAAAKRKIMAVFLLSEGGLHTTASLAEFVEAPLQAKGIGEPHSPDETRNMQEKSLRVMAIDSLAEKAKTDRDSYDLLVSSIGRIEDPYLKSYAERKLAEIAN